MKHLLPFFLFFLVSCGWFDADEGFPNKEPVAPPPVDAVSAEVPGKFYYLPTLHGEVEKNPKSCDVIEFEEFVEARLIEAGTIDFVYKTINFDQEVQMRSHGTTSANFLHLKEVWLEIAAGDSNFNFLSWVKVKTGGKLVAWGGPNDGVDRFALDVDGSVELKSFMDGNDLSLNGQIRGHAPDKDTYVQGRITFIGFYDCD